MQARSTPTGGAKNEGRGVAFPMASEFISENKRKARGGGNSGRGKATSKWVPRLSASLGKTIDSIKNQSRKKNSKSPKQSIIEQRDETCSHK